MAVNIPDDMIQIEAGIGDYYNLENYNRRRLYLYGTILDIDNYNSMMTPSPVANIVDSIIEYNREDIGIPVSDRKPIIIYINSPGGDMTDGFSLVSVIQVSKTPVYTVNIGEWSSMAFLIGITGDKRFSLPNMTFLLHDGSSYAGGTTNKIQDLVKFEERFGNEVIKKHVLKYSNMKSSDYDMLARVELYMLPEEAKERGFIDEIVTDIDAIL